MPEYLRYKKRKKRSKRRSTPRTERQARWEQRIVEAEWKKEEWKQLFMCDSLENLYYGFQRPDEWPEDNDWFTINLILASAKILKRNVCPRQLEVKLDLTKAMVSQPQAISAMQSVLSVREAILQHMIDNQELWREGQMAYINSLWQFGAVKVGYSAEMESNPNAGKVSRTNDGALIFSEGVPQMEGDYSVVEEEFFIDTVDPDNIMVDRYCTNNLDKTGRFVAEKIYRSVQDMREDSLYETKRLKDLGPSSLTSDETEKLERTGYKAHWQWEPGVTLPENEIVVLYEIYDLYNCETLTLARGARDIIRGPMPLPPGIDKHPYVFLKQIERRSEWYPVPTVFNWRGPQKEYGIARNQQSIHRKRFNRKYIIKENAFDPDELSKLEVGADGTFATARVDGAIEPLKDAPLDTAAMFDVGQLRDEFMESSGVGQLQRSLPGAESATEAEIVEGRSREGELDEHEELMSFMSAVMRKLNNCMEANLTQEGAVKKLGPMGAQWISFGPEHFDKIAGEVFFKVQAAEAARMTVQVERAQMLQLMEIIGRNPMILLSPILLRQLFDKFPAFAGNEELIQEIQRIGLFMMQMQMQEAKQKGNQGQTKQVANTSVGKEASKSRQTQGK